MRETAVFQLLLSSDTRHVPLAGYGVTRLER